MDIEKYLKKEKLEKSVSNLKANDRVKQKILDESIFTLIKYFLLYPVICFKIGNRFFEFFFF